MQVFFSLIFNTNFHPLVWDLSNDSFDNNSVIYDITDDSDIALQMKLSRRRKGRSPVKKSQGKKIDNVKRKGSEKKKNLELRKRNAENEKGTITFNHFLTVFQNCQLRCIYLLELRGV